MKKMNRTDPQKKIKMALYERGITQAQLAKLLGLSEKSLSNKMLGQHEFTWAEIKALCQLFDVQNPFDIII